ncbi:MAG: hypothetical protein ACTS73_07670 [Arsenophonus sp. NEOnobi-MAG3]
MICHEKYTIQLSVNQILPMIPCINSFVMVPGNSYSYPSLRLSLKLCCNNMLNSALPTSVMLHDAVIRKDYLP